MKKAIRAAVALYQSFREKHPRRLQTIDFDVPEAVAVIGHVDEICYTTTHGKKTVSYRHEFAPGSRPLMTVSSDGGQLLLLGGRYKFNERGIMDRDAKGRLIDDPRHGDDDLDEGDGHLRRPQAGGVR